VRISRAKSKLKYGIVSGIERKDTDRFDGCAAIGSRWQKKRAPRTPALIEIPELRWGHGADL
jgi:hypothetical protein